MTETSALDAFIRAKKPSFDMAEYQAALQSDWERGQAEEIAVYDCKLGVSGGIIRRDGYEGYVGTMRFDGTPLSEFRSIARTAKATWREVFAKDIEGKVWYVGNLKWRGGMPGPSRPWKGD